jgi:uncharacterized phage protein (TIGR01671 family)
MRTIKFRAWNKLDNKYVCFAPFPTIVNAKDKTIELKQDRYILEQSTGLYDKNGKEIFEGDIIKVKDKMENTTIDCKIQFESGSFSAVPLEDGDLAYIMFFASQNGEIIANIHDKEAQDV